ncbi:MAG: glycoside hydrolase N-terminal domain-containing protein [Phycisphaerae bacterium]|nr:glycoside hydrolase N-terminal domain-containing protein [Phycisphaerae bacterium]
MSLLRVMSVTWPVVVGMIVCANPAGAQPQPGPALRYTEPALVWDEAMPLGNGLLGALVWGDGRPLRISLDRTDLWDLRPVPEFHSAEYSYKMMRQWVKEGRIEDLHRLYDKPYGYPGPTKIPAGRIELRFDDDAQFQTASLDIAKATTEMRLDDGTVVRVFVHAQEPLGVIHVTGKSPRIALIAPPFAGKITEEAGANKISAGDLATLRYEAPVTQSGDSWTGYLQKGWGDLRFAVALAWRSSGRDWLGAWSICTSKDSADPLAAARKRCEAALDEGLDKLTWEHEQWWAAYWSKASVSVPNPVIERQWYLETYKFGAAARPDTPPITLQGPWTADDMKIPPWKGDYHHDLNTQLSYWPAYSGNRLDGAFGYVRWLWATRENARDWTKRFFALPGLNVPMTADLEQNQIGGWHQYTHSATTAAWLGHHFYLQWRYSMDPQFLEERLYPWLRDTSVFLEAVTEKGVNGKRTLPLSSSPEINDDRLTAWFPSITNYDVALIRWAFKTTAELATELGKAEDAQHWRGVLAEMPELAVDPNSGKLLVAKDYPLPFSHRHFSHLMAIHPLGMIRWENGVADQAIIKASLAELDAKGTSAWCGYSFSWLANLAARARDGDKAERALEIFARAFCLRNGFHCNGDQSGKGYSSFRYRPFTLEGNFAAAAGLQEMLLQSYSGTIRVFPAIPASWKDVSFKTLRAEGAFLVTAERKEGVTQRVEIIAEKGGLLRLENPFPEASYAVTGIDGGSVKMEGTDLIVATTPSQRLSFSRR